LPPPHQLVDHAAASLPQGSALLEYIAYTDSPLLPKPGAPPSQKPGELRYLALLLFPDGSSRALDLGPAAPIDRAVQRLHAALSKKTSSYLSASKALESLLFQPLLPLLPNTRRLFIAPDGQLHLVPFAALHDGRSFLLDSFDITYLSSGRDLLRPREERSPSRSVVVVADPDFTSAPSPLGSPSVDERSASLEPFFSSLREELPDIPWAPLPGTRKEAIAIQRLFPHAQLLLGPQATKQALLTLETPGVLHVATHGFFLEDSSASPSSRAVSHFGALAETGPQRLPPEPLLRSGLMLAGAHSPSPQGASPRREDSLVTALELAGLNLWGTQLVVLSACDTGRGDLKRGQGVYGLRHALQVAGAQTVVSSLWKVDDDTTQQLMEGYYQNLLAGQGRTSALRDTMRALRRSRPHPYFWAPFIALGLDSPLQGMGSHTATPQAH
jgi:CHAT domain-containing protein